MDMPNDKRRTLDDILDEFYELSGDEKHKVISEILSNSNIDLSSVVESMQRILESVQRAVEHIAKPLTQFAANFSLERVLRGLILKTAEDRLQRGDLDKDDAKHLTEERDEFLSCFDAITGWPDNPEHRKVALTAILSAFAIGLHSDEVPESVKGEIRRNLTKAANEARRAPGVREIIEYRARDLWGRNPDKFKDNNHGTAVTILHSVITDILELQRAKPEKIPAEWRPPKTIADSVKSLEADGWKKKVIYRITNRVRKMVREDK